MKLLFSLLFVFTLSSLQADQIDHSIASFEEREKKQRVDLFDFSGAYPLLENIDIDARRKKNVEVKLTGEYPILETINYEGGFGTLKGKLTGLFPKLLLANFLCSNAQIDFDLKGDWEQSCEINIRGLKENVTLKLPENIGVIVHTQTKPAGKVVVTGLKKKGRGLWKKTYVNSLAETSPIILKINVEVTEGAIILN